MRLALLLLLVLCGLSYAGPAAAVSEFVTVGTASVTGVYYPAGGAICRYVNRERKRHNIRCAVEATNGSIDNLIRIRDNDLDFGIVQSDWQYYAYYGKNVFADRGPDRELRSVMSLHSEAFAVFVRKDSGINSFDDLKGKRVNLGNPGSGMVGTLEEILREKKWSKADFKALTDFKYTEQADALCTAKTDALLYNSGHPNGAVQEIVTTCPVKIIGVSGPVAEALVKNSPYYAYATIPGGMYFGNPDPINTFGVKATMVTSTRVSDQIVYEMVKAVFDNIDSFKTLHPVFSTFDAKHMMVDGNTAPMHEGALRYYREKGLMKPPEPAVQPATKNP